MNMPEFGSPFSELANDRKLRDEERVHAGVLLRLLRELAPKEETLYAQGAKVEEEIEGPLAARLQSYRDLASGPVFGANRPDATVSQGMVDSFRLQGTQAGHPSTLDCLKAFSETDFTGDLRKFDVPTLVPHGDDDQIVPIAASALRSSKLVKSATLKIHAGAPHGLAYTHKDRLNADLFAFLGKGIVA